MKKQTKTRSPRVPVALVPHGLVTDRRIESVDALLVAALLYWAGNTDHCTASNRRFGAYVGVSHDTITRSLKRLQALGYIECHRVRPTESNMTGRVITLRWIQDPSIIPAVPQWEEPV